MKDWLFPDTPQTGNDWLRLRTVLGLRWAAIGGQFMAVLFAQFALGIDLPLALCLAVVLLSVAVNLGGAIVLPENKRLSAEYIAGILLFDLFQLALMLHLTGGLTNPFVVLIVGPVVIAATALPVRQTTFLGGVAIALTSLLMFWYRPLTVAGVQAFDLPDIYIFGMWLAMSIFTLFFGIYAVKVTGDNAAMSEALVATQMALSREQRLSSLGGVVAAAAHELGTPLATIKLAAGELAEDLALLPDADPQLVEDAHLIREQADRCRVILADMGRAGKDDLHLHYVPLEALIEEAAEPHVNRGKQVIVRLDGQTDTSRVIGQPGTVRTPEVVHGLRNLIQNAVDFAHSTVWIDATWDLERLRIAIGDDGPGYPEDIIGRLGDPFLARRRRRNPLRPGYEGMGLGLFIAKTLLERSGAVLTFTNATEPGRRRAEVGSATFARAPGALVDVVWPRDMIAPLTDPSRAALGQNSRNDPDHP
ncbi:sensor histidine kinase RegB [Pontivivens nitratireducens]|uniref:sensor histidine kinase RegB n=1 Tax=Pontivivens nitratireducens TaxID=2758038 RepID=UPI001639FA00|nr:ActS/PrrB/RegB family redox-sensitive histidine kinase [Pontibrevibacter nitratireducens]